MINHTYINRPLNPSSRDKDPWSIVGSFDTSYYSGIDIDIYFNNVYIEEAVQLSYDVKENTALVYGYSDYVAREIVHGTRIIAGSFLINFTEANSLLKNLKKVPSKTIQATLKSIQDPLLANNIDVESFVAAITNSRGTIDTDRLKSVKGTLDQRFWQSTTTVLKNETASQSLFGNARFDIYLKYGDPIIPGNKRIGTAYDGATTENIGTIEGIVGASITGVTKVIDDSGRPIQEQYSFVAKDIIPY